MIGVWGIFFSNNRSRLRLYSNRNNNNIHLNTVYWKCKMREEEEEQDRRGDNLNGWKVFASHFPVCCFQERTVKRGGGGGNDGNNYCFISILLFFPVCLFALFLSLALFNFLRCFRKLKANITIKFSFLTFVFKFFLIRFAEFDVDKICKQIQVAQTRVVFMPDNNKLNRIVFDIVIEWMGVFVLHSFCFYFCFAGQ